MTQPPKDRHWVIEADPQFGFDQDDLLRVFSEIEVIIRRIGGVVTLGAVREELSEYPGVYETTRVVCRWSPFAPAPKKSENGAEAREPEPAVAE